MQKCNIFYTLPLMYEPGSSYHKPKNRIFSIYKKNYDSQSPDLLKISKNHEIQTFFFLFICFLFEQGSFRKSKKFNPIIFEKTSWTASYFVLTAHRQIN
ncbi:hypothetical protein BpHYR1_051905 [Brachionus plicatilis]|uniref:Uncharacterized protein n=1 Tax=Brachionus plicatilis TaxID=10195 RepID=A0A3M7RLY6_BRAPC|nr:hypothetical protein BpHYR1_051905 [Brachionus plicatilis]